MKNVILTTTINLPLFLEDICKNLNKFKNNDTSILVIGDKKTPIQTNSFCKKLNNKYKIKIEYLDTNFQDKFFKKNYSTIYDLFPFNDAIRRILGLVYLHKFKPERVIFIDDDNYIDKNTDFIKEHSVVNKVVSSRGLYNKNLWPNVYSYLATDVPLPVFPRGFPWNFRNLKSFENSFKSFKNKKVLANCGFILEDPDIDAVSRLFWKIRIKKINTSTKHIYLAPNMYCPFNDQNTCISGEILTLYFKPLSAGRNSDIWTSYLINKVASIHSDIISYGSPYAKQYRNIHDNWKDYELEKMHNISTDYFIKVLNSINFKKNESYYETFLNLCKLALEKITLMNKEITITGRTNPRHYQSINENELKIRKNECLIYIKNYFIEYKKWLVLLKKFNLVN